MHNVVKFFTVLLCVCLTFSNLAFERYTMIIAEEKRIHRGVKWQHEVNVTEEAQKTEKHESKRYAKVLCSYQ